MKIKQYIKRGLQYIIHGIPEYKINAKISTLAPNEMLQGRTALITGGTSGIGKAIAKAFLNAGANVVITSRSQSRIDDSIVELTSVGGQVYGFAIDQSNVESIRNGFRNIVDQLCVEGHQIDILVNNAGIGHAEFCHTDEFEFDKVVDTNLKGTFFWTELVSKYMTNNQIHGNILNIGSSSSIRPATSAYHMTKWGIRGLTMGWAKILIKHDIVVNAIAPGPTATPMLMPNGICDDISFPNQLGRYELPEEIANMAVILVSNMGRSIIGDMVFMTGGSGVVTYDDVHYSF